MKKKINENKGQVFLLSTTYHNKENEIRRSKLKLYFHE